MMDGREVVLFYLHVNCLTYLPLIQEDFAHFRTFDFLKIRNEIGKIRETDNLTKEAGRTKLLLNRHGIATRPDPLYI